jgi:hypothetical protein
LTTEDNRNYELDVKQSKNKLTLYARRGTIRERAHEKLAYDIEYSLLSLAFFMIMRLRKDDFTQVTAQITPVSSPTSFKTLLQDSRILSLLEKTRKLFNERYETFVELKESHSN